MKVLVCGGRYYSGYVALKKVLDNIVPTQIVHGGASGADTLAQLYAKNENITTSIYLPDWDKHGKAAGPIRNQIMLDQNPDIELVVALPGGRGTADMVRRAKAKGLKVVEVED